MRDAGMPERGMDRHNARGYVEGSAAWQIMPQQAMPRQIRSEEDERVRRRQTPETGRAHARRRIIKAAPMNKGYIAVMAAAVLTACGLLMSYVKMQSDITNHINTISSLESRLNELKLSNDETYTKIMSSINLEEIKRIAVNELGMKYAKEGQVVQYTGEGNDYVRQYSDIPK